MEQYANLFGQHLPMTLSIERELCRRSGRLNPSESSNLLLEISTNRISNVDVTDYMGCEIISG